MAQTRKQAWLEVVLLVLTFMVAGTALYMLLPMVTAPDQIVVPPPREMSQSQLFLTIFVAMTAVGAPVTAGIVLALVLKFVSKRVSASSSLAPAIPSPIARPHGGETPREMSAGEARVWKIAATVLLLMLGAGAMAGLAQIFAQFYK